MSYSLCVPLDSTPSDGTKGQVNIDVYWLPEAEHCDEGQFSPNSKDPRLFIFSGMGDLVLNDWH